MSWGEGGYGGGAELAGEQSRVLSPAKAGTRLMTLKRTWQQSISQESISGNRCYKDNETIEGLGEKDQKIGKPLPNFTTKYHQILIQEFPFKGNWA